MCAKLSQFMFKLYYLITFQISSVSIGTEAIQYIDFYFPRTLIIKEDGKFSSYFLPIGCNVGKINKYRLGFPYSSYQMRQNKNFCSL